MTSIFDGGRTEDMRKSVFLSIRENRFELVFPKFSIESYMFESQFYFLVKFQEEEEGEEGPSTERRTSRGYQFRQRHLSNIISTIEAREKEEGKEGEPQRVRLFLFFTSVFINL